MRQSRRVLARSGLCAVLMAAAGAVAASSRLLGAEAPDFVLKSVAGRNLRLSEHRGEVVMLSFGATWCGDCRAQLEQLGGLHERYQEAGATLFAVSLDQTVSQASAIATGTSYVVLHDAGGEVGRLYEVAKVPVVVLIDRSGVVREVYEGYRRGDEVRYLERLQALLRD